MRHVINTWIGEPEMGNSRYLAAATRNIRLAKFHSRRIGYEGRY